MTPKRRQTIQTILDRRQKDLTVLMENVHKPHNYSAVLRSCDAVGVYEAHAIATGQLFSRTKAAYKSTSGSASKWVGVNVHGDIDTGIKHLQGQGFEVLAATLSERAVDFRDIDYTRPTAILLGAEKDGVSPRAAELADKHIIIPMLGMVESLNVSVAAAVILFEAQRQRLSAGCYDRSQIPAHDADRLFFEWLHPKVAARYRSRGLPYPALDDDGDILNPNQGTLTP